jgi:hypothetical protein
MRKPPDKPRIDGVLEEFLKKQRSRLAPRTLAKYDTVLRLLKTHLNGYASESLSASEAALFERCYNAEGEEHREFCELFGPEKIVENLDSFLDYFMNRKVIAGEGLLRSAGTVTKKLSQWLGENGYVSLEAGDEAMERSAASARDLPKAERAAQILRNVADRLSIDAAKLADDDYLEFDHYTIAKVEPGQLSLAFWQGGRLRELGPIPAPEPATRWLRPGWSISCALGRIRKSWRLLDVANVYPG